MSGSGELTTREREILAGIAEGRTDREIALDLGIGRRTVSDHVSDILDKLGARNRAAAVAVALQRGLIEPPGAENNV